VNLSKTRVVIVGAGQAGGRAAEASRAAGHVGPITLIGEQAHPPYEQSQLSKSILLDGEPNPTFIRAPYANIQIVGIPAAAMRSSGETSPMSAASPSTPPATCPFCAVSSRRERPFTESILKTRILN